AAPDSKVYPSRYDAAVLETYASLQRLALNTPWVDHRGTHTPTATHEPAGSVPDKIVGDTLTGSHTCRSRKADLPTLGVSCAWCYPIDGAGVDCIAVMRDAPAQIILAVRPLARTKAILPIYHSYI